MLEAMPPTGRAAGDRPAPRRHGVRGIGRGGGVDRCRQAVDYLLVSGEAGIDDLERRRRRRCAQPNSARRATRSASTRSSSSTSRTASSSTACRCVTISRGDRASSPRTRRHGQSPGELSGRRAEHGRPPRHGPSRDRRRARRRQPVGFRPASRGCSRGRACVGSLCEGRRSRRTPSTSPIRSIAASHRWQPTGATWRASARARWRTRKRSCAWSPSRRHRSSAGGSRRRSSC